MVPAPASKCLELATNTLYVGHRDPENDTKIHSALTVLTRGSRWLVVFG